MFCPQCGKTNSAEGTFCRSCGLSLDKVKQSLAEQLPEAELDKHLQHRKTQVERILTVVLGSAFTVAVLGMLWALIYKMIIVKGEVLKGSFLLGLFVAAVTALLMVIYRESLQESITRRRMSQLSLPERETTAKLPEPSCEPLGSVTERTTELLFAEDKFERKS
jgi:hypothetical protein